MNKKNLQKIRLNGGSNPRPQKSFGFLHLKYVSYIVNVFVTDIILNINEYGTFHLHILHIGSRLFKHPVSVKKKCQNRPIPPRKNNYTRTMRPELIVLSWG